MKKNQQSELELKLHKELTAKQTDEKLTKKELAHKLDISLYKLNRFQSGAMDPRLDFLKKVTSGLGLKLRLIEVD